MIATSIEQSRMLLDLGLDPRSADMYYSIISEKYVLDIRHSVEDVKESEIPAWSIGRLFDMLMRYDSFEEIEIGHVSSEELIDSLLDLVVDLLEDSDEIWQKKYKIEK